jgi:hypothetical protein
MDKKMKGVNDWTALPTGVAATAAVGQARGSGDKKKVPVTVDQFDNLSMSLENAKGFAAKTPGCYSKWVREKRRRGRC